MTKRRRTWLVIWFFIILIPTLYSISHSNSVPSTIPQPQSIAENNADMMGISRVWLDAPVYNAAVVSNPVMGSDIIRLPFVSVYGFQGAKSGVNILCQVELDDYALSPDGTSATLTRTLYYAHIQVTPRESENVSWVTYTQYPVDEWLSAYRASSFHLEWARDAASGDMEARPISSNRANLLNRYIQAHDIPLTTIYIQGQAHSIADLKNLS